MLFVHLPTNVWKGRGLRDRVEETRILGRVRTQVWVEGGNSNTLGCCSSLSGLAVRRCCCPVLCGVVIFPMSALLSLPPPHLPSLWWSSSSCRCCPSLLLLVLSRATTAAATCCTSTSEVARFRKVGWSRWRVEFRARVLDNRCSTFWTMNGVSKAERVHRQRKEGCWCRNEAWQPYGLCTWRRRHCEWPVVDGTAGPAWVLFRPASPSSCLPFECWPTCLRRREVHGMAACSVAAFEES